MYPRRSVLEESVQLPRRSGPPEPDHGQQRVQADPARSGPHSDHQGGAGHHPVRHPVRGRSFIICKRCPAAKPV